jgi:hypothetical protein
VSRAGLSRDFQARDSLDVPAMLTATVAEHAALQTPDHRTVEVLSRLLTTRAA